MTPGSLRHRLLLERPQVSQSDTGDEVVTWVAIATVWAAIEPVKGREALRAGQVLADIDTLITIRWSSQVDAVTAKCRARYINSTRAITYDVVSVAHVKLGRQEIQISARSGLNEG